MLQGFSFIRIRLMQVAQEGRALGVVYSLLITCALFFILFVYGSSQSRPDYFIISNLLVCLSLFLIHRNRNDTGFIRVVSENPALIRAVEYNAFVLPFAVISLLTAPSPKIFFLPVICFLIALLPMNKKTQLRGTGLEKLVPEKLFEWRAGLRKQGIYFLGLWIIAMGMSFLPFATLVITWILLFFVSAFYEEGESREMLISPEKSPPKFLHDKLKSHLSVFFILTLPLFIMYTGFFPMKWWVALLFVLFLFLNLSLFIVSKYSVYVPGESTQVNSLMHGICMSSLFIPFLLPLPLIMLVRNYRRALKNLKFYLDDFN